MSLISGPFLISSAYAKSGVAIYYSHLDTVRILERALRRTGLPVRFTQGCNPHIRLSTYWALPLGVATDREWFSVYLTEDVDPEEVYDRLNRQLPEGFSIAETKRGSPDSGMDANYHLAVHHRCGIESAQKAADQFMMRPAIEVTGMRKGRMITEDMRPFFDSYRIVDDYILFELQEHEDRRARANQAAKALNQLSLNSEFEVDCIRLIRYDSPAPEESELAPLEGSPQPGNDTVM